MSAGTIVLYPAPGVGHIVSMVELGNLLHLRYRHRFSITILLTSGFFDDPNIDAFISATSKTNPSLSFLRLPHVTVDTAPTRSPAAIAFEFILLNTSHVVRSLNEIAKTSTIKSFIIDFFSTSALAALSAASRDGPKFPTYYFFTSGAAALAVYLYMPTIHHQVRDKSFKDMTDTVLHFPGLPPIPATHMPEPLLDRNDPAYLDIIYFSSHLPKSDGILVNTFDELEPITMAAITGGSCVLDTLMPPVYNIGPLIAAKNGEVSESRHECLCWLDSQPSHSVVFLCFGSRGSFEFTQLNEMAQGIEKSGKRFLWVLKRKSKNSIEGGFIERTEGLGQGLVVEDWIPQVEVLSHDSVGVFVTHCGWNSVLEAVVAGKPMVAWPLYAEQHVNKAALVDHHMGLAVPVEAREDGLVSGDELARAIGLLMDSDKGRPVREKCWAMKEAALAATGVDGSSTANLARLVDSWT